MCRALTIIVASVSSIYGIGSKEDYMAMTLDITSGMETDRDKLILNLIALQYKRNDVAFERGSFRVRGDTVELFPSHMEDSAWRFSFFGDEIEEIIEFDALTGKKHDELEAVRVYANSHYITPGPTIRQAIKQMKVDLKSSLAAFEAEGKLLEAQRLDRAMYKGDRARKSTLVEHGFRLPAAIDNRPLKFEEWNSLRPQTVYVSATPAPWEIEQANGEIVEQVVRPTGLIDPPVEIRPTGQQVDDLMSECHKVIAQGGRIMVTTLTKKMAEALTEYLVENGLKVRYMHSDIETLERIDTIRDLRLGEFDILVGINLLREGLDIPECMLMAILDADKEGFLRSKTSLVQTIGRAARNVDGRVILYADKMTGSMEYAIEETNRRRAKQEAHNKKQGITPESIKKNIGDLLEGVREREGEMDKRNTYASLSDQSQDALEDSNKLGKHIEKLRKDMRDAAGNLEFEQAAKIRDEIKKLEALDLGL